MRKQGLQARDLDRYREHLLREEHAPATIENYLRNIRAYVAWMGGRAVTRELASAWKEHLLAQGQTPVTVNSKLSALNKFFTFMGWNECRVKYLKIQRRLFRGTEKELTREEYVRLLETADTLEKPRLSLLMETICATGIRVSEVKYITVEAAQAGRTDISLKGKIRTILIPGKLCRKLQKYAKKQKIASGEIFGNTA